MKLKPLQDRIVVKPLEEEQQTKGGIIIPETAKEKPLQGEVLAVGPGKQTAQGKLMELSVKNGDKVLYSKYAGTEIKLDNEEVLIIRENDVLGIMK